MHFQYLRNTKPSSLAQNRASAASDMPRKLAQLMSSDDEDPPDVPVVWERQPPAPPTPPTSPTPPTTTTASAPPTASALPSPAGGSELVFKVSPHDGVWTEDKTTKVKTQWLGAHIFTRSVGGHLRLDYVIGEVKGDRVHYSSIYPPAPAAKTKKPRQRSQKSKDRDQYMKQRKKELAEKANAGEGGSSRGRKHQKAGPARESPLRVREAQNYDETRDDDLIASDDNTIAECEKSRQAWLDLDKNKQRDSDKMLTRLMAKFLPYDNLGDIQPSSLIGAGNGLFTLFEVEAGEVIGFLTMTCISRKMNNEMVRFFGNRLLPWNDQHLDICNGCMANSCGEEKDLMNAVFQEHWFECKSGKIGVVLLVAARHIDEDKEIFIDYPLPLAEEELYEHPKSRCSKKPKTPDDGAQSGRESGRDSGRDSGRASGRESGQQTAESGSGSESESD